MVAAGTRTADVRGPLCGRSWDRGVRVVCPWAAAGVAGVRGRRDRGSLLGSGGHGAAAQVVHTSAEVATGLAKVAAGPAPGLRRLRFATPATTAAGIVAVTDAAAKVIAAANEVVVESSGCPRLNHS